MSVPWYGEIMMFGGNFPPLNWAFCSGAVVPIAQNETLFQLIGTAYGGDGQNTFNLPNLSARFPVGRGQGAGLQNRQLAESGGISTVTLFSNALPSHAHALSSGSGEPTSNRPDGTVPARGGAYGVADGTPIEAGAVASAGGTQPHDNMPPFLTLSFCVSLSGIFPSPP